MPNWYTTQIGVTGSEADIKAFREKHFFNDPADGLSFDFNTIIPQPVILDGVPASSGIEALVKELQGTPVAKWTAIAKKRGTEEYHHAIQSIQAFKETGHYNWYTWANEHWGTKWNASEFDILGEDSTSLTFRFNTAWGPPEPVLRKMVADWPSLQFDVIGHGEEDVECDDEGNVTDEHWEQIRFEGLAE